MSIGYKPHQMRGNKTRNQRYRLILLDEMADPTGPNPTNMPDAVDLLDGQTYDIGGNTTYHFPIFSYDGLQLSLGREDGDITVHSLSTAFTPSSTTGSSLVSPTGPTHIRQIRWSPDGLKCYILCFATNAVYQYALSNAFDMTDLDSLSAEATLAFTGGVAMELDASGTYIYCGALSGAITRYTLATPWDIDSAGAADYTDSLPSGMRFDGMVMNADGTKMWMQPSNQAFIRQYTLQTPYDTTDATYDSGNNRSISGGSNGSGYYVPFGRDEVWIMWYSNGVVTSYTW